MGNEDALALFWLT